MKIPKEGAFGYNDAMVSRKISRTASLLIGSSLLVVALGMGLLVGYQYIQTQTQRLSAYEMILQRQKEVEQQIAGLKKSQQKQTQASQTAATGTQENPSNAMEGDELWQKFLHENVQGIEPEEILLNEKTPGVVMVHIMLGDGPDEIASKLQKAGIIQNRLLYKLLSKFNGFDGRYQAGTHYLKRGMNYDAIMFLLTQKPRTVRVRIPEELTYPEFKDLLKKAGLVFDEAEMDRLVSNPTPFLHYNFVQGIPNLNPDLLAQNPALAQRSWPLQGYIFPDTYDFDINTNVEAILTTILNNTEQKLQDSYYKRAEELGMTMDRVITLASIIQMESGVYEDMALVSRVFHNRLAQGMGLQSCATINYLRRLDGEPPVFIVSEQDMARDSHYNTYRDTALPPGPICSPGLSAIRAALYPDVDQKDILYFCAKGDGTNAFATTLAEHEANIERYLKPLQDKADRNEIVPYDAAHQAADQKQGRADADKVGGA